MSRPDAAEQIGHGPESRGQSETADVDDEVDPRKRATDPTRRRVSRTAGEALTDAVNSLDGVAVHANTLIIGDASVGTMVGRDYLGAVSGRGFVPSGPVSPTMLQHLENTFVPPSRFEEVRSRLRKQKVLLLRAPKGWGRTAAALRALAEDCGAGVQKLNPDVRLRSLELEFTPETGYLLESLEVAQAIALRSFHLEQLSQTLTTYRCRMIVVLDNEIELPADIDSFLLDGGEPPDVTQLVSKHLDWRLRGEPTNVLERPEVVSLLAEMGEYRAPARELALLAGQLAQVAVGRVEITDIVTQYSAAADIRFQQWFDELDVEARAFAIALAVFNGMPLHIVSSAGRVLAQLIMDEEISDVSQHRRSVFGTR
ncbi:hypothetical protein [Nocardia brasiliensis]|nr:hypothetical protein [Nocardia brasiliensis]